MALEHNTTIVTLLDVLSPDITRAMFSSLDAKDTARAAL